MNAIVTPKGSIPGQVFLSSMDFIEHQIEIQRLKSTTNASRKIKTNLHEAHNQSTFKSSLAHVWIDVFS